MGLFSSSNNSGYGSDAERNASSGSGEHAGPPRRGESRVRGSDHDSSADRKGTSTVSGYQQYGNARAEAARIEAERRAKERYDSDSASRDIIARKKGKTNSNLTKAKDAFGLTPEEPIEPKNTTEEGSLTDGVLTDKKKEELPYEGYAEKYLFSKALAAPPEADITLQQKDILEDVYKGKEFSDATNIAGNIFSFGVPAAPLIGKAVDHVVGAFAGPSFSYGQELARTQKETLPTGAVKSAVGALNPTAGRVYGSIASAVNSAYSPETEWVGQAKDRLGVPRKLERAKDNFNDTSEGGIDRTLDRNKPSPIVQQPTVASDQGNYFASALSPINYRFTTGRE